MPAKTDQRGEIIIRIEGDGEELLSRTSNENNRNQEQGENGKENRLGAQQIGKTTLRRGKNTYSEVRQLKEYRKTK